MTRAGMDADQILFASHLVERQSVWRHAAIRAEQLYVCWSKICYRARSRFALVLVPEAVRFVVKRLLQGPCLVYKRRKSSDRTVACYIQYRVGMFLNLGRGIISFRERTRSLGSAIQARDDTLEVPSSTQNSQLLLLAFGSTIDCLFA